MQCVACGAEIPPGSRFCPQCGRAVPSQGPAANDPLSPSPGPPPPGAPPPDGAPPPRPPTTGAPPPHGAPPPGPPTSAPPRRVDPNGYTIPPPPPPPPSYGPPPSGPPPAYGPPPGGYGPAPGGYPAPPPYGGGAGGPVEYGLASFGQRVGAFFVDSLVLAGIYIFGIVVAVITTPSATPDNPEPSPSALGAFVLFLSVIGTLAYPIVMEGRPDGQTVGKKALGIRVVRRANGASLGYGLAGGRFLARMIEAFTFGIGLLMAAWDPLHQTIHDKIAGTLVVRSTVYPPPRQ